MKSNPYSSSLSKQWRAAIIASLISFVVAAANAAEAVEPFSAAAYAENSSTKGVVLVSVNWGRLWKCGQFENAQLKSLSFDKADFPKDGDNSKAELVLEDASILPARPAFVNYAYVIEPGEYLLSAYSVKAAQSISNVGYFKASRSNLIKDGRSEAGSFTVAAGEIVYIGHFFLDCAQNPMPWRYYPSDRSDFNQYLSDIKREFVTLDTDKVKFRLFDTTTMGNPFTLP